ncbi:DNA-binding protein [Albidovulum sp.]|uniref:DNA-binding protein n=1 Tax=Albidovulum sp. TaxID=1872424 RepID=UPI0039B82B40
MTGELPLTVHVPAEEWAYAQRRLTWLETLLLRVVRDRGRMQEWYDAGELAALRLPGLPVTRTGIAQKAGREGWPRKGRAGRRVVFHVSALPSRAFDALIARMLDLSPLEPDPADLFDLPAAPVPAAPMPPNAAPSWVLPLMRILRGEAKGDLACAWRALPAHLPPGTVLPDVKDAAKVLVALGIA